MNWKTIKTFLIFLFLAVDVFLIFVTYNMYNSAKLSEQNISDTLALLQRNNISADADIIPRSAAVSNSIQLTNIYYSDMPLFDKSQIMFTDNGNVSVALPCKPLPAAESEMPEFISNTLAYYGFDTDNISILPTDGSYVMTYSVNGMPVFNNKMTVTAADDELNLVGSWFVNETENTYTGRESSSIYATSALVEFISHPDRSKNEPVTVTGIDLGYYANVTDGASEIKIISASPCYRLTTDTGKVYYYSILDSKFIN